MKKSVKYLFVSIILILILASANYSQTSPTSTPQTDRAALVTLCERAKDEVISSRALIASYEDTLKKAEASKALSEAETLQVRDALESEKAAMAKKELEIREYQKALAKEVKKKNFYKTMLKTVTTALVVTAAIAILR